MWLSFTHMIERKLMVILFIMFSFCPFPGCGSDEAGPEGEDSTLTKRKDPVRVIPGRNEALPEGEIQKGKVLIAYSDCYTCHTIDVKAKGPSFKDIAKKYPVNKGYIELLAQKIIVGGSGVWGYPVMTPHPDIPVENAKLMVKYILSLKK
jgi:cytochrome c